MHKNSVLHVLIGAGTALGLAFLLVFGVAVLIWSGTLPASTPSMALSICMGVCAFVGGRVAIGKGSAPMVTGIVTGTVLVCFLMVICLIISSKIPSHGGFLALILLTLAGGAASGLFGGKKKQKKKKKK